MEAIKEQVAMTGNLVNGESMSASRNRITFPVPYQNVSGVNFTMSNARAGTSDAYYYFYDSKGVNVGAVRTNPANLQSQSGFFSFDIPIEVAYVDLYSWWNPAIAKKLVLNIGESHGSSESGNLVSGQYMGPGTEGTRIDFPKVFKNVRKASYTMKALTYLASSAYYYFYNSKDQQVGIAHAVPANEQSVTSSVFFDNPVEIAYMKIYSWWNPAEAESLTFTTSNEDATPSPSEIRIYMRDLEGVLDRLGTILAGKSLKDVNVTKAEVEALFANAVTEFREMSNVQKLSLSNVDKAVNKVYDKVRADVTAFFDEEIAEESLNAVSGAALAGGSIFSAFPLVAVIFDAVSLGTMATAMGLSIDLQIKGPKIMAEAAGLKSLIDQEPLLAPARKWNNARSAAIETIGRLKGIEESEGSSYLYALLFVIDQTKPNLTDAQLVQELKTLCLNFNNVLDEFPSLGKNLYDIVSSENPSDIAEKVQKVIDVAPPGLVGMLQSVIPFVSMTAILSFQTYRRFDKIKLSWHGLGGKAIPQGMETRWRRTMTNIDKVQSAAGAIISIFGAAMSIWQAVNTSNAKQKALENLESNRDAVKEFYSQVIKNVR